MAKATRGTRTIKRVKRIQVPSITLELSEGEADFLQAVLCKVSGDEVNSPRKYAVRITRALEQATGQKFDQTDAYKLMNRTASTVRFKNYPTKPEAQYGGSVADALDWIRAGTTPPRRPEDQYSYGYRPYPRA